MSSTPFSSNPGAPSPGGRPSSAKVDPSKLITSAPAQTVVANSPSANPAAKMKMWIVVAGAGAVGLAAIVLLIVWSPWKSEPPRLNDPPEKIARFVSSTDFEALPFNRQRTFMEHLDKIEDQVKKAHEGGKLTDAEFGGAKQAAWYGKRLTRMGKYFEQPAGGARNVYVDKLLDKREKKKEKEEEEEDARPAKGPKSGVAMKRDDSRQDEQIGKWPPEVQAQWSEYMEAYKARKALRKEREAASTQQTAPAKVPAPKTAGK